MRASIRSLALGLVVLACAGPPPACIEDCIAAGHEECAARVPVRGVETSAELARCEATPPGRLCRPGFMEAHLVAAPDPDRMRILVQDFATADFYGEMLVIDAPRALAEGARARVCLQTYDDLEGHPCASPWPGNPVSDDDPWACAMTGDVALEPDGSGTLDATWADGSTLAIRWRIEP